MTKNHNNHEVLQMGDARFPSDATVLRSQVMHSQFLDSYQATAGINRRPRTTP